MAKSKNEPTRELPDTLTVGEPYLFLTNTRDYYTGRLLRVDGPYSVVVTDWAWIADTGRFHEFLASGNGGQRMEVEPAPAGMPCGLTFSTWMAWPHPLPREVR